MKLPKAPLKEVIFEVLWDVQQTPEGIPVDAGFDFALGVFARKIRDSHPRNKKIFPDGVPFQPIGKVTHQFWRDEMTWPIVQLGPGVMTVNDTDATYDWENSYSDLTQTCLSYLFESYDNEINIKQLQLKYIDAIDLPPDTDCVAFLKDNLRIEVKNGFDVPGEAAGMHVDQGFRLNDGSFLALFVGDGKNDSSKQTAIIWTTTVWKSDSFDQKSTIDWLNFAHQIASTTFKKMVSSQLYQTFQ